MADGVVALDPDAARTLATAMRTARDAWQRDTDTLGEIAASADLALELRSALDALADVGGDCELAAIDLDLRADLVEAIDAGNGATASRLSFATSASITRWEAAVTGGVDAVVPTTTVTTGADFTGRFAPSDLVVGGPGVACAALSYRQRGSLVGPDGRSYALTTPAVDHVADDERYPANADWGPAPAGADVWSLDGSDPGWVTIAREQGVGQVAPEASGIDFFLAGPASRSYATSSGYAPASLAAHERLTVDEYGVPTQVAGQRGGTIRLPDSVEETGARTPVVVVGPSGQPRFEVTTATRGAALGGVAELVGMAADAGLTARHVREQGNYAYTVAYQEHPDGRRRAIPVVYHLALDGDGDPVVFMGYLAPDADGDLHAVPIRPRVHDGYQPRVTVNPTS